MQTKVQVTCVTQKRLFTGVSLQPGYLMNVKVVQLLRGPPTKCYILSGSWVGSLIGVWIPGAVLAEGWAAAQICNPRLLVTTIGEVGLRCLVQVLEDQAAVWHFGLTGAAGDEASGIILRGVGQTKVSTKSPRCGALIISGCCLGLALPPLLLLQLCNFLTYHKTWRLY